MKDQDYLSGEMESKIIDAATRVFVKKGRTGTSMQNIADEAGINRTLLNYYFRSKDKLFTLVFNRVFGNLISNAEKLLKSDKDILLKIEDFIDLYIRTLLDNPLIPVFVLNELSTNPDFLIGFAKSKIKGFDIINELNEAMRAGKIKKYDPVQLILSLISMVVFPFAAKSIFTGILQIQKNQEFEKLMEERILFLKENFIHSIKV